MGKLKGATMNNSEQDAAQPQRMHINGLTEIRYALDAIEAAVKGADFLDHGQQRGISHLLSEQYFKLGDIIKEMEGEEPEYEQ
jgi:hypothetical protein